MTFADPSVKGDRRSRGAGARLNPIGRLVDCAIPALQSGHLRLVLPNGEVIERCGCGPGPEATLRAHRWRALWRLLREGEAGLANGYLDGDWSTPELARLFELGMENHGALMPRKRWLLSFARNRIAPVQRANTRRGSRRNVAAHYDLGNDFFRPWLDQGMNYSSALYTGGETLEQAQQKKLDRIARLLELTPGQRVLEIGCGWGTLAEFLIRRYGVTVFGITLSAEQLRYVRARLAAEVDQGRADLRLMDYRDVQGRYDRIASIEMIEAVGERYWSTYFAKLRARLAGGGIAIIQAITIAEGRFARYRKRADFIQRHIFPGGMLPTRSIIEREAARANLTLVHQESFGDSYVETLREWRSRFIRAWPIIELLGFNDRFRRMWEYYLTYCEIGFRFGVIDVSFFKLTG